MHFGIGLSEYTVSHPPPKKKTVLFAVTAMETSCLK
jgi:hypothetical protein